MQDRESNLGESALRTHVSCWRSNPVCNEPITCNLAIRTTENDQTCKVRRKWKSEAFRRSLKNSLFRHRHAGVNFECLRMQVDTVSDKRYLWGKKTHNAIQNLQIYFAIASNRRGKRVCECSTHANQEMISSEADVHSPVRSRPYRSKI